MKIERINENQIRCTLTSFDLSVRNLNLGELAYGSEKARKLFREMIKQAEAEVGFDAEDIPLMVEAIPLSGESVMLVITKIEDPEELDTRFSRFSPVSEEEEISSEPLTNDLLEGADSLLGLFPQKPSDDSESIENQEPPQKTQKEETPQGKTYDDSLFQRIFCFPSLDAVTQASRIGGQAFEGESRLYKNSRSGKYYLVLKELTPNSDSFVRFCNLLIEYGSSIRSEYASQSYFDEHYECIIRKNAAAVLSRL